MPLLPKCRCKLANGCHESYDSRLHFVCVRCVALHLRDDQLRIKFRKNGQRGHSPCGHFNAGQWGESPCGPTPDSGDSPHVGSGDSPHVVHEARKRKTHAGLDGNAILRFSSGKLGRSQPSSTGNLLKRSAHSSGSLYYNRRATFDIVNRLFDIADKNMI